MESNQLDVEVIASIEDMVRLLVSREFESILQKGYSRMPKEAMQEALANYPGALVDLPDEWWQHAYVFKSKEGRRVEVPLWTQEEGESDLFLYVIVDQVDGSVQMIGLYVP